MLNIDPNILNQDKIRLERRKRWLKIAIIPLALIVCLAIFYARTGIYNIFVTSSNDGGDYQSIKTLSNLQAIGNLIEPYVVFYNRGVATLTIAEDEAMLSEAENEFRTSLKQSPPDEMLCAIYGNLSYSLELKADLNFEQKQYNEALALYSQAEALLYEENCASKEEGKTGTDELSENAKERISAKRRKTVSEANGDESDESSEENTPSQEMTESDLEAVEKLNVNNIGGGAQQFIRQKLNRRYNNNNSQIPSI